MSWTAGLASPKWDLLVTWRCAFAHLTVGGITPFITYRSEIPDLMKLSARQSCRDGTHDLMPVQYMHHAAQSHMASHPGCWEVQPTFVEPTAISFGRSKPRSQACSAANADVLIGHEATSSSTSDAHYPVRHGLVRRSALPRSFHHDWLSQDVLASTLLACSNPAHQSTHWQTRLSSQASGMCILELICSA